MSDIIPNIFLKDISNGNINYVDDHMNIALCSGTFNGCHLRDIETYNQLSQFELSNKFGYTTGGIHVSNKSINTNAMLNEVVYDMDDVSMTVSGGNLGPIRYGVLYNTVNANHNVYIFDFLEDKYVNDGAQFKIKIDDGGLMKSKQCQNI